MVKKINIFFVMVALLLIGCDKMLDIKPEDTLVETDVFAEEDLAERALGEAYLKLVRATCNTSFTLADFTTEITKTEPNEFYFKFIDGGISPEDETISSIWLNFYATINASNGLIAKIPVYGQYDQELMDQHVGEAKFIRAFAYFKLLCLFGQGALTQDMGGMGLPLQLTPFEGYNENDESIPRSTVEQVYNQIIKDLKDAIDVVPESYGSNSASNLDTRTRATKGSVYALLSRVYLYKGDFEEAGNYAKMVIDLTSVYELTDDITELFPNNSDVVEMNMSDEYILGFPFSRNEMGSNNLSFSYYFKLSLWADDDFINSYPPGDLRVDELIFEGDTEYNQQTVTGRRTTMKYSDSDGRDNVVIIRLAEVMLTRAEVLARTTGINQESVDLLNDIHLRANPAAVPYQPGDFTNSQHLIDTILHERKLELAFEGHARYDLIRTGQPLRNPNISEDYYILPIPQTDIEISKGVIKQNPGY